MLLLAGGKVRADATHCDVCGVTLSGSYYTHEDAVTGEKRFLCKDCVLLKTTCFICGMPVKTNYTTLKDGRLICARDAQTAVIEDDDAKKACREAKENMDRVFSRFMEFPETNVTIRIVDREHLKEMFKAPGQDSVCPNVWGYIESRTNQQGLTHAISLLNGLPRASFEATCAHEYTHAWLNQNLSARRKKTLGKDANEGFCELIAYLLMDSENEEAQKRVILANTYTRGQIKLFIEAEQTYGINEIADWMKHGADDVLSADNLQRVRVMETPHADASFVISPSPKTPVEAAPETLMLKAVFMSPNHPEAVINNRSFEINETGRVRLGTNSVAIRCLSIGQDSVRIKLLDSGEERELRLKPADN